MDYSKIPVLRKVYLKIKSQDDKIFELNQQIKLLTNQNINLRYKIKRLNNEKINVIFVCWRPAVWGSLKTVYESMKSDDLFNVNIVVIPNKKQLPKLGLNHENYESEGGEVFWKGEDIIQGYNYETKEWIDLKSLNPDYVCFQQPYNSTRSTLYKSKYISRYAKIFYIAYYAFFNCNESNFINMECTPCDYMEDLSFYFTQNKEDQLFMEKRMIDCNNRLVNIKMTGFPRFDRNNRNLNLLSSAWKNINDNRFRIIWTPRWCTNENNCHFFDYKDKLVEYCMNQQDIDFVFRPHPQAFLNWEATGEFPKEEALLYKEKFTNSNNMNIDFSEDFLPTFYTAGCMITDTSSVIPEFFLTGNPIIYCHKKNSLNSFAKHKGYTDGFYWAENWNDVNNLLDMLRNGNDPLKQKRQELIKSEFYIPKQGAGYLIKEEIKKDFFNA